jgi:hypothetical protein
MSRPVVSIVLIAVAIAFFAIGRYSGGHRPPVWPRGPTVIGASIDLKCGDTKYTVSTGTDHGNCSTQGQTATCDDKGGHAEASCASGCISSNGAGSCSVKKL